MLRNIGIRIKDQDHGTILENSGILGIDSPDQRNFEFLDSPWLDEITKTTMWRAEAS
jgi:hypothetical protein